MGVTMEQVNAGLLDLNKILAQGMTAWNTVTGRTPPLAQTTTTPAVTPGAQTAASQAAGGIQVSKGMLIVAGLALAALFWKKG